MIRHRKAAVIAIIVVVLLLSLFVFSWAGFLYSWSWNGWAGLAISCIFLAMWLAIPYVASKMKSKAMLGMHYVYWITAICVNAAYFAYFQREVSPDYILHLLFFHFSTPLYGFANWLPHYTMDLPMFTIVPLCMFMYGLFMTWKFFKKELKNEGLGE